MYSKDLVKKLEGFLAGESVWAILEQKPLGTIPIMSPLHRRDVVKIVREHRIRYEYKHTGIQLKYQNQKYLVKPLRLTYLGRRVSPSEAINEWFWEQGFTCLAMAIDPNGELLDPFGGKYDIRDQLVRTIGSPDSVFGSNPALMFRAFRVMAQTGFDIESNTLRAVTRNLPKTKYAPVKQVAAEINLLLLGNYPDLGLKQMALAGLLNGQCQSDTEGRLDILPEVVCATNVVNDNSTSKNVFQHTCEVLKNTPNYRAVRWAALLHDIGKGYPDVRTEDEKGIHDYGHAKKSEALAKDILARLRVPHPGEILWLIRHHMAIQDGAKLEKWTRKHAEDFKTRRVLEWNVRNLYCLWLADAKAMGQTIPITEQDVEKALAQPLRIEDLRITTKDIYRAGYRGIDIAKRMTEILHTVQSGFPNNRKLLLDLL